MCANDCNLSCMCVCVCVSLFLGVPKKSPRPRDQEHNLCKRCFGDPRSWTEMDDFSHVRKTTGVPWWYFPFLSFGTGRKIDLNHVLINGHWYQWYRSKLCNGHVYHSLYSPVNVYSLLLKMAMCSWFTPSKMVIFHSFFVCLPGRVFHKPEGTMRSSNSAPFFQGPRTEGEAW